VAVLIIAEVLAEFLAAVAVVALALPAVQEVLEPAAVEPQRVALAAVLVEERELQILLALVAVAVVPDSVVLFLFRVARTSRLRMLGRFRATALLLESEVLLRTQQILATLHLPMGRLWAPTSLCVSKALLFSI